MSDRRTYKRKPMGSTQMDRVAELLAKDVPPLLIAAKLGMPYKTVRARISDLVKRYGG